MTFLVLAKEVLSKAEIPLNYAEIWDSARAMGLDKQVGSEGKTPQHTLRVALTNDIKNHADSPFCIVSKLPTTFWLKERENELEKLSDKIQKAQEKAESKSQSNQKQQEAHERDLHPLLVRFVADNFGIRARTIFHEKCKKHIKGKRQWSYPDIVGVKFPFDRTAQTLKLLSNINQNECKIYSFELKKSIDFDTLKQYYFQAVSNSSFANEGYLAVLDSIDIEVLGELERLNANFGIGVIQLNVNAVDSAVILPAKQRNLDIETLDMLVVESPCFRGFINDINECIRAKEQSLNCIDNFDEVMEYEKLEAHIKERGIVAE